MARIIGGIAASHTPTIGFAYDRNKRDDPVWAPIFENFAPLSAWLAEKHPDVLLWIYNDHVTSFFFDHYSAFALGVGPEWPVADEGGGRARSAADEGASAIGRAHRPLADGRRVRHVLLPEPGARPRLLLAALGALPARAGMARAHRPAADGRAATPDAQRAPLLQAGTGASTRHRKLSGGSARRSRRHRWAIAPGAWRARGLQQSRLGSALPRPVRARSGAAGGHDHR